MNREQAMDKADRIVSAWTEQVKNERGYVHDKWKPVDIEERTKAVIELASFLWEDDDSYPAKVEFCNWCPNAFTPDPERHPGGQARHAPLVPPLPSTGSAQETPPGM